MPNEQVHRFANVMPYSSVSIVKIPRAGHLAGFDQPEIVAETIVNFVRSIVGVSGLGDIFLGLDSNRILKGDEDLMINDLRTIYSLI